MSGGAGTIQDRHSQVAVGYEYSPYPIAAWAAQRTGDLDYCIVFRLGYPNNTWSSWFWEFAKTPGINSLYPALTDYMLSGFSGDDDWRRITIVYHISDKKVKMKPSFEGSWKDYTISTNGYFPNITRETSTSGKPKYLWTDQSVSPYQIYLSSQYLSKEGINPSGYHRRAVISRTASNTSLAIELGEFQVRTAGGDILAIDFPKHCLGEKVDLTLENLWDYLTSEPIILPNNADALSFAYEIYTSSPYDSSGTRPPTPFTAFDFQVELQESATGERLALLHRESIAEPNGQLNLSKIKSIDITSLQGRTVVLQSTVGHLPPAALTNLSFGVGDIWFERPGVGKRMTDGEVTATNAGAYELSQNHPNPFNIETEVRYHLAEDGWVSLAIYNLLGQKVKTLVDGQKQVGGYTVRWDGKDDSGLDVASGVYLYHITVGNFMATRKMILLR